MAVQVAQKILKHFNGLSPKYFCKPMDTFSLLCETVWTNQTVDDFQNILFGFPNNFWSHWSDFSESRFLKSNFWSHLSHFPDSPFIISVANYLELNFPFKIGHANQAGKEGSVIQIQRKKSFVHRKNTLRMYEWILVISIFIFVISISA
jgi:hypothetical protein